MVIYGDVQGRIVKANEGAAALLGMSIEALVGKTAADLAGTEAAALLPSYEDVIRSGEPRLGVVQQVSTSAGRRWIEIDTLPYRDAESRVQGVIVFGTDITERIRTEHASKASEEQFRALFELAPVGIARVDAFGRLIDANRALLEMAGYTLDEMRGRAVTDFPLQRMSRRSERTAASCSPASASATRPSAGTARRMAASCGPTSLPRWFATARARRSMRSP